MLHDILNLHVLSVSIWLPILAGIVVLLLGSDKKADFTRWLALAGSLAAFFATLPLYTKYNFAAGAFQFEVMAQWIPAFNINYHLGVDGIAAPLILLTSFTTLIVVIAGWQVITKNVAQYMAAFLIMSGLMIGVSAVKYSGKLSHCQRRARRQEYLRPLP